MDAEKTTRKGSNEALDARDAGATPEPVLHGVQLIDVTDISPSPLNPRKTFKEDTLAELAEDLKVHGMLQAICVRPSASAKKGARYELVFGERRWRAAKLAGMAAVPASVRVLSDLEVLEIQIVENAKREDIGA